jgi:hypothetical protein
MKRVVVTLTFAVFLWPGLGRSQDTQVVVVEERPIGMEFARSVSAPVLSVVYFPVKLSVGVVGALLGGMSGWATGGNERAAEGIWRPMTGGSYFVMPETLSGERPFLPFDGGPYSPPPAQARSPGSVYMQP